MYAVIDGYVTIAHAERRISFHQGIVYRKLDEQNYYQVIISIDFLSLYMKKYWIDAHKVCTIQLRNVWIVCVVLEYVSFIT